MSTAKYLRFDARRTLRGILYHLPEQGIEPATVDLQNLYAWPVLPWRVSRRYWADLDNTTRYYTLLHKAQAIVAEDGDTHFLAPWPTLTDH